MQKPYYSSKCFYDQELKEISTNDDNIKVYLGPVWKRICSLICFYDQGLKEVSATDGNVNGQYGQWKYNLVCSGKRSGSISRPVRTCEKFKWLHNDSWDYKNSLHMKQIFYWNNMDFSKFVNRIISPIFK